jgi:hypothetical protein
MTPHQIKAAISRLRRLFVLWDGKLDDVDKEFALRRIRDEEPEIFYKIAAESRH